MLKIISSTFLVKKVIVNCVKRITIVSKGFLIIYLRHLACLNAYKRIQVMLEIKINNRPFFHKVNFSFKNMQNKDEIFSNDRFILHFIYFSLLHNHIMSLT